jgi:hypothetical protein
MIALAIASSWLALSALGFAGLSALRGGGTRADLESCRATPPDSPRPARLPRSQRSQRSRRPGPERTCSLADSRALIARALQQ